MSDRDRRQGEPSTGPWRRSSAETNDYPRLWVHDHRQSGSITLGRSRLPIWAIIHTVICYGWDQTEQIYEPSRFGWGTEELAEFLQDLLAARGEFARLLLAIADAGRQAGDRRDAELADHGPAVNVTPGDPSAVQPPQPWWNDPAMAAPVVEQLRRCLAALNDTTGDNR